MAGSALAPPADPTVDCVAVFKSITPVPCVLIDMSPFEVSFCMVSALSVVISAKVAWKSAAVTVPPNANVSPANGLIVIPPDVELIVLASILKLSTFNCPVTVPVPVILVGPERLMAPVPEGSMSTSPLVSVVILP